MSTGKRSFRTPGSHPLATAVSLTPADLATFVGAGTRYLWPESYDLRRIPIVDPTPIYPHSIIWREDNPHPGLAAFLDHLRTVHADKTGGQTWVPTRAEQ